MLKNVGLSYSPSVVVFNDKLFCFHHSFAETGELWYSVSADGISWSSDIKIPHINIFNSPSSISASIFKNSD